MVKMNEKRLGLKSYVNFFNIVEIEGRTYQ